MKNDIIIGVIFFVILISIQYTLNKVLYELRDIKKTLIRSKNKDNNLNG